MSTRNSNASRTAAAAEPDVRIVSTAAATYWWGSARMCGTMLLYAPSTGRTRSHDFRSSFRDWAAERTDHSREVTEAGLAHVVQNKVEAAYARSDLFERRRLLMDEWAAYLAATRRPR